MDEIQKQLQTIADARPIRYIISKPGNKTTSAGQTNPARICLTLTDGGKAGLYYQEERIINNQSFHRRINIEDISTHIATLLDGGGEASYRQVNAFSADSEYNLHISKKGKVLVSKRSLNNTGSDSGQPETRHQPQPHNRTKHYIFEEGAGSGVIPALVDMGVFTRDGKVVKAMYGKYRQINRFAEIVGDVLGDGGLLDKQDNSPIKVIDFGCGKSYLTFLLYHYLIYIKGLNIQMTGVDLKSDVIKHCNDTARAYGYEGLSFEEGDICSYKCTGDIDIMISLHACDTASDYALAFAIKHNAKLIFCAPCCQHELNAQIKHADQTDSAGLPVITRYGLIKEHFSALLTDALRSDILAYKGYKVQLVEFADDTHTPKNTMIRAVKSRIPEDKRGDMLSEIHDTCTRFGIKPTLASLLNIGGKTNEEC